MDNDNPPTHTEIESLLNQYEALAGLELADFQLDVVPGHGAGGHDIYSLQVEWSRSLKPVERTFVLKRWTPASPHSQFFGLTESYEAVAHRTGLFAALPASIHAPIVASSSDADGGGSWLLMQDVSAELDQYGRPNQFPFAEVKQKVSIVLDRLAQMHVHFERSNYLVETLKQSRYNDCATHMSTRAAAYRHALGKGATGEVVNGEAIDDAFVTQLRAYLDWLSPELRPMWERVLMDRSDLIAAANALPHTLLHGDLDDRNIGMSVDVGPDDATLMLIDWEWICTGPGAFDAAKPIHQLLASCTEQPELLDTYFEMLPLWGEEYAEAYQRHGGTRASADQVLHVYHLGHVREAMSPFPHVIGSVLVAKQREEESVSWVPSIETNKAMFDLALAWGERTLHYVSDYMQTQLQLGR